MVSLRVTVVFLWLAFEVERSGAACAPWCSKYTIDLAPCVECAGCGETECGNAKLPAIDSAAAPAAAAGECAQWCGKLTCEVSDCAGCDPAVTLCEKTTPGCAAWCKPLTCSNAGCLGCAELCHPLGSQPLVCEAWCNDYTVSLPPSEPRPLQR